jgi:uncharacterized membrane protein YfcA
MPSSRAPSSSAAPRPVQPVAWRVAAVGVLAGLASGLFGVGGGVVIVPGLVMVAAFGQRLAHGTSLTAIVPIALAGAIGYATAGEVDLVAAAFMAGGAVVGAPLGVAALARIPQRWLQLAFGVLLVLAAVRLVMDASAAPAAGTGREAVDLLAAAGYVAVGLVSGGLAGLLGVGGGVVIVPLLTIAFGFPIVAAKGTSLAVIVPTAVVGTVRNRRQATTDLRAGALVGVGGVVTAALASQVSLGLDPVVSAWLFAGLLLLMAARLGLRAARSPDGA